MKSGQSVRLGAWLLIALNLLMAYGCVWIFMRMAPVIGESNYRNLRSLAACEDMLIALSHQSEDEKKVAFLQAFQRARSNITEAAEPSALELIQKNVDAAFDGDVKAREEVIAGIIALSCANRMAMEEAAHHGSQLGYGGAWGVVFMALWLCIAGFIFKRRLINGLVAPLEEIDDVLRVRRGGDLMRRCSGVDLSKDVERIFSGINDELDHADENR